MLVGWLVGHEVHNKYNDSIVQSEYESFCYFSRFCRSGPFFAFLGCR